MAAGIYIHIPFCKQKCLYCDFVSKACDEETRKQYIVALKREIESTDIKESVDSVFLGGGTPSILSGETVEALMEFIQRRYPIQKDAEITIEANPGTIDEKKLRCYQRAGINRISFGLQSANEDELKILGRIHTYQEFIHSYKLARMIGFQNINIDLMSAIPKQTFESYQQTLEKVCALEPEHISAYSLIVEEHTPFYDMYGEEGAYEKLLPDEDTERKMYHYTKEYLELHGWKRYEISNYARAGKECKHNLKYWERENYYGFGVAASSLVGNRRYTNLTDTTAYMERLGKRGIEHTRQLLPSIREYEERLEQKDEISEYMFLGLRKMKGISKKEFFQTFGIDMMQIYGDVIRKQISQNLCVMEDGYLHLTEYGIDVSNVVMAEYV